MPRFDVTTFGEGGLRLSVPAGQRIETTAHFDVSVAGTEANVVGTLSQLGWKCGWVSGLPNSPAGRRVSNAYRSLGIDLSAVVWRQDARVSIYYVEYSEPPRPITVGYDRKDSCVTQLTTSDIDWGYLLDTRHLHMSGITLPLSAASGEIVTEALRKAREKNVTTSFDVNYRNLLWSPEQARERLVPAMREVDILFCSLRDAVAVFGCDGEPENVIGQLSDLSSAKNIIVSLSDKGAVGWDGTTVHRVSARAVGVVDRVGAGDAMIAGILHGYLQSDFTKGLSYGTLLAAMAMSQHGETVTTNPAELETLLSGSDCDIVR